MVVLLVLNSLNGKIHKTGVKMYQVKLFGPAHRDQIEQEVNYFLQNTYLKVLDTKTRADSEDNVTMTIVLATARPFVERLTTIVDCPAGSDNINYALNMFKQNTPMLNKIEDVVIVPANKTHSALYLKIIYSLKKGSNTPQNKDFYR